MKISIITATHNSARTISDCIASVFNQTYPNVEHIIIDGASIDNTLEIIKSLPNRVTQIISESDKGIYDALNKGIELSTGDVIGFLHSDDILASPQTLENVVKMFTSPQSWQGANNIERVADGVYGNLVFIDSKNPNNLVRIWQSKPFKYKNIRYGWMPPHPTLFLKKYIYQKHGMFDISFKIAGDYDFMLRVMQDKELNLVYLPEVITKMRIGGISTRSLKDIINKSKEDIKAMTNNGIHFPYVVILIKNLRKLAQLRLIRIR